MLLGQYRLFLDDQHRLVLPEAFRQQLQVGAYVTCGFERNLLIMSEKEFESIYQKVAGLNLADPLARLMQRLLLGNASRLETGPDGRVRLPNELLALAGLEKEIVLVGQGEYCEAWAPVEWEKQASILREAAANSARFAQLDLAF